MHLKPPFPTFGGHPWSVVDLPESYKNALAGVTGTFRASFQPISSRFGSFREGFPTNNT
jgi:hypothetical protein